MSDCAACGHDRVFHQVGTGNGVPVGVHYCDDRHALPCNCKGFVPMPIRTIMDEYLHAKLIEEYPAPAVPFLERWIPAFIVAPATRYYTRGSQMRIMICFKAGPKNDVREMRMVVDNRGARPIEVQTLDEVNDTSWRPVPVQPPHSAVTRKLLTLALLKIAQYFTSKLGDRSAVVRISFGALTGLQVDLGHLGDCAVNT